MYDVCENETKRFEDLRVGQLFVWANLLYQKVDDKRGYNHNDYFDCRGKMVCPIARNGLGSEAEEFTNELRIEEAEELREWLENARRVLD